MGGELEETFVDRVIDRMVFDAVAELVCVLDAALRVVGHNRAFERWLTQWEVSGPWMGQVITALLPFPADEVRQECGQVFEHGEPLTVEHHARVGGQEVISEVRWLPVVRGGRTVRVVGLMRDVTQARRAARFADRLRILQEMDRAILGAGSPEAVALAAMSRIRRLIPYRRALVMEATAGGVRLLGAEASGGDVLRLDRAVWRDMLEVRALRAGLPQGIEDVAALPHRSAFQRYLYQAGVRSYLLIPLIAREELIGVLYLDADRPHAFTGDHVEVALEVGASMAVAIRQARLYQQTRRDAEAKAVLLEEINRRVKNNLLTVVGLLQAERHVNPDLGEDCDRAIDRLTHRIEGLAEVNRMLANAQWSLLPFSKLVAQIIRVSLRAVVPGRRVAVDVPPSPIQISPRQANSVALIVHELTGNTLRHAKEREPLRIAVRLARLRRGERSVVRFEFRDNGPGYPDEVLQARRYHVGLHLISRLVHFNLHGTLTLMNDGGAVTIIEFEEEDKDG